MALHLGYFRRRVTWITHKTSRHHPTGIWDQEKGKRKSQQTEPGRLDYIDTSTSYLWIFLFILRGRVPAVFWLRIPNHRGVYQIMDQPFLENHTEAKASCPPCVDPAIVQYTMQMVSSISYPNSVTPFKTMKKMPRHRYPSEKYHALGSWLRVIVPFSKLFVTFWEPGTKNRLCSQATSGLFEHLRQLSNLCKWDRNTKVHSMNSRLPSSPKNGALERQELFFNYFELTLSDFIQRDSTIWRIKWRKFCGRPYYYYNSVIVRKKSGFRAIIKVP